ncbi:glycosyltransferase family 2 protein [Sphingosinicella sp. BN140058]|uniref:glycosyltransferase family 2 protein n=1 Tax=Sphingosinicella sp. BN140058 TaxID=1892855 RepID=UPI0013ED3927|nr:glycosyltransferase family 2 protein [Sphingosinicella sp. BN140058]
MPFFSILLATRDRPALFDDALASVLAQSFEDFEIVVVDDGSAEQHLAGYAEVLAAARTRPGLRLQHHRLVRRPSGHGQSYSLNVAAAHAAGDYLAILDDDDVWTDAEHLARAARSIGHAPRTDLYMANQRGFRNGEPVSEGLWLVQLERRLAERTADADGSWRLTLDDLLAIEGFCHLNCLIVRRGLWEQVGGMDEAIRWECDRDLYLRLIDTATGPMLHHPAIVSRHNIPDPTKSANMTTALSMAAKRLQQLRVADKAALFARSPEMRTAGRRHRTWTLQKLAQELAEAGDFPAAAHYARAAAADSLSPAFAAKAAVYTMKALGGR